MKGSKAFQVDERQGRLAKPSTDTCKKEPETSVKPTLNKTDSSLSHATMLKLLGELLSALGLPDYSLSASRKEQQLPVPTLSAMRKETGDHLLIATEDSIWQLTLNPS